ncbi:MAG: ABC transporter permease [Deltaproteobacteria bacterium]|nr:ABC transporter permease [Deltaproteobacteria bacterium]
MDHVFIFTSFLSLLQGVPLLIKILAPSLATGFVLSVGIALARLSSKKSVSFVAFAYIYFFRSTPLLVQIFMIYYGLSQFALIRESFFWQFLKHPYWCAVLALTMNTAAYTGEIFRGGFLAAPWGQIEAGRALGMSGFLLFRRIIMPIAIRQALPAYSNEIILMVKATSLASTITLMEVTGIAHKIISETYRTIEVFTAAGIIYLFINFLMTRSVRFVEHRLSPHLREATAAMAIVKNKSENISSF